MDVDPSHLYRDTILYSFHILIFSFRQPHYLVHKTPIIPMRSLIFTTLQPILFAHILSTGLSPSIRIPLFNTCLAATYSANLAIITFLSLPTTCKWS